MTRVKLPQDAEGHKSGETVDIDASRAKWLVTEGYASTAADADGVHATSVPAQHDPRLAENREDPDPTLREQMAAGLGLPGSGEHDEAEVTPVPTLAYPDPIERSNGKGDQAKGNAGKDVLERKAVATDAEEQAVELNPELAAEATAEGDKVEASSEKVEDAKEGAETTEEAAEAADKVVKRRRS